MTKTKMIRLKDLVKFQRPDDKLTLNRLREFCKYFDDMTLRLDFDAENKCEYTIRCLDRDYVLRLVLNQGTVTTVCIMEYPNCDLFEPSFETQGGDGLVVKSEGSSTMQDPTTNIEEADPSPASMPQEILTFVDDTATQKASLPEMKSPHSSIMAPGSELRTHTIEDILSRPTKITQQTWSVGQTQNTDIYNVAFPDAIIDASDIIKDKLQNFTYLRADICVRVILNASTFQQGKLLAYFAPFSRVVGTRATLNEHLPGKTAFPSTVLDAATGNSGDLRIPFVSPYTHYNLTTQQGDMGNLKITVLNRLQTLENCTVTVFAWFENIDLGVPTARPNLALASARNISKSSVTTSDKEMLYNLIKKGIIRVKKTANTSGNLEFLTPYKSQCDDELSSLFERLEIKPKFVSQIAEDKEKSQKGLVTETLEHIGGAASGLKNLPVLGDVFKPVEWIANSASKVSALLGLSKPTSVETQSKFQNVPGFGFTHTDGLDQSVMLACKPDNQLQMRGDLFGSNVDEMDINYIAAHSCWFQTFFWPASVDPLVAPTLNEIAVHPGISPFFQGNYEPTLTAFVSAPFRYWRGGLTYKIQAAKTSFHSGRIRIAYVPSGQLAQNYNLDTCYSWVMDLRTSDQIEFTIPYISNTQYKEVTLAGIDGAPNTNSTTGVLVTEVLNALRAPDTVSQTIDLNMWISGASDFQLAIPDFDRYRIGNGTVNSTAPRNELETVTKKTVSVEEAQDLLPKQDTSDKPKRIGKRSIPDEDYDFSSGYESQVLGNFQDQGFNDFSDAAQMFGMKSTDQLTPKTLTIGEDISNVRSLIKRFGKVANGVINRRAAEFYVGNGYFGSQEEREVVPLRYFSWIYRFWRGGIRYKYNFFPEDAFLTKATNPATTQTEATVVRSTDDSPEVTVTGVYNANPLPAIGLLQQNNAGVTTYDRGANFVHRAFVGLNPCVEVTAPYYSNTPILPITAPTGIPLSDINYNATSLAYRGKVMSEDFWDGQSWSEIASDQTRQSVNYYTAAADDFSMGWLVGPPYLKNNT